MNYHGDIALGETIYVPFTTRRFSSGAPFTLAGTPAVSAYVDAGTTEITAGITLGVDHDARTGLNMLTIVATSGNGFAAGTDVSLVITAGTVDSVSVVGEIVGSFSIENRSGLRPTTAGRTLDVTATGAAGIDWGNVENPTTAVDLSATDIQLCDTVTTNTDMRGTDGANTTTPPTTAAIADAVLDEALSGHVTAGTLGKAVADIETDATAILADTGTDGVVVAAGSKTGYSLTATTGLGNQTANITGNLSGSVGSVTGAINTAAGTITTLDGLDTAQDTQHAATKTVVDNLNLGIIYGAAATGTLSTTQATTDLTGYADDQLIGRVIIWTSGNAEGEATDITDSANTGGLLTFTALTTAPGNADTFKIV